MSFGNKEKTKLCWDLSSTNPSSLLPKTVSRKSLKSNTITAFFRKPNEVERSIEVDIKREKVLKKIKNTIVPFRFKEVTYCFLFLVGKVYF